MNRKRSDKKRSDKKRSDKKRTRKGGYVWKFAPKTKSRTRSARKSVKNSRSIMASLLPTTIN